MVEFYPYSSVGMNGGEPGEAVAEKIRGTVHLAISDSSHMGRMVTADLHQDFVIPGPDLLLDGKLVIEGGQWKM